MIDNKTQLNTSLYTPLSSGAVDVIMWTYPKDKRDVKEPPYRTRNTDDRWWEYGPSENNWPPAVDPEREEKIPIGDRYTVFLGELFTNTFLINVDFLAPHKMIFINFKTTKYHSFSLDREGNKSFPYNIEFEEGTDLWGKGTVRNLEKYFEGYPEGQVLEFDVILYKGNSYKYYVELYVNDNPDAKKFYKITYLPNTLATYTYSDPIEQGQSYKIKTKDKTNINPRTLDKFKEWNTKPDGSGTSYKPGDEITPTENLKLFAIWSTSNMLSHLTIIPYNIDTKEPIADHVHINEPIDSVWFIPGPSSWWTKTEIQGYDLEYVSKSAADSGQTKYQPGEELNVSTEFINVYYMFKLK